MARDQYPSDEARRKSRPHVKVHLTVATHLKTAAVWADPESRGMLVELWRIAGEAFASKTDDTVCLSPASLRSITGRERHFTGVSRLATLCSRVGYEMRTDGAATFVTIRNFAKKQGFDSARRVVTPRTPHPSELRTPNTEYRGGSTRSDGAESGDEIAARFTAEAVAALPEPWCQQLVADRPDLEASVAGFRAWLRSRLPAMRERGYRSLRRTAANWWTRAAREEVVAAIERDLLVSARVQARASPPRPAAPIATGLPLGIFETQ